MDMSQEGHPGVFCRYLRERVDGSYIRISGKGKSGSYEDGSGREMEDALYLSQEKISDVLLMF